MYTEYQHYIWPKLTKVRPLFTLSHRGSDESPLLIVFSANYIDQLNCDLYSTTWYFGSFDQVDHMPEVTQKCNNKTTLIIFKILHSDWNRQSDWSKSWCNMQVQILYKDHLNTISNGDLSDPLCDSINRGLTSVRLNLIYWNMNTLWISDLVIIFWILCNFLRIWSSLWESI